MVAGRHRLSSWHSCHEAMPAAHSTFWSGARRCLSPADGCRVDDSGAFDMCTHEGDADARASIRIEEHMCLPCSHADQSLQLSERMA